MCFSAGGIAAFQGWFLYSFSASLLAFQRSQSQLIYIQIIYNHQLVWICALIPSYSSGQYKHKYRCMNFNNF